MEAMVELMQLSEAMMQSATLLADEDSNEPSSKRTSAFLNVVGLGNRGAGKMAVLSSLIGTRTCGQLPCFVKPTGENGGTSALISRGTSP